MTRTLRFVATLLVVGSLLGAACSDGSSSSRIVVDANTGTVASDFQSLADYLNDPTVLSLLDFMPRHQGGVPPDTSGSYQSDGVIAVATDGSLEGLDVLADFCFGIPAGADIDVEILDGSVEDAGARSFIEGEGDLFTVYTAFRSVQFLDDGSTCEIHEAAVISGRLLPDGSITDLVIGFGIVGLVGACENLFLDDIQISDNIAERFGESCAGIPLPDAPGDLDSVLVAVENNLVVDVLVFLDDDTIPIAEIPALGTRTFETLPGFALAFESVQPLAGTDDDGLDILMGEIVAGTFPPDDTVAGDSVAYSVENQVGADVLFAPLPLNQTDREIFSVVNLGFDDTQIPGYAIAPSSGLDCFCILPPSVDPFVVGYYSYITDGVISAPETNVHFFDAADEVTEITSFQGPFFLEELSGTVTLTVR